MLLVVESLFASLVASTPRSAAKIAVVVNLIVLVVFMVFIWRLLSLLGNEWILCVGHEARVLARPELAAEVDRANEHRAFVVGERHADVFRVQRRTERVGAVRSG